jgi:hypothetical protein
MDEPVMVVRVEVGGSSAIEAGGRAGGGRVAGMVVWWACRVVVAGGWR